MNNDEKLRERDTFKRQVSPHWEQGKPNFKEWCIHVIFIFSGSWKKIAVCFMNELKDLHPGLLCIWSSTCLLLFSSGSCFISQPSLFIFFLVWSLTCGDPSDPWSLVFLASLFFFLWSGLDSRIISSSSKVGSQFSLRLCRGTRLHIRKQATGSNN